MFYYYRNLLLPGNQAALDYLKLNSEPPQNHFAKIVNWNKNHLSTLREILNRIVKMIDENGAVKYSTKPNAGHGPYQTLETLLPFILYPQKDEFSDAITKMTNYVLNEADPTDGGYKPFPEYPYWEFSAIDSTAYAIHVFALLRDYLDLQNTNSNANDLISRVNLAIKKAIYFVGKNNNNDDGWGFVKNESLGLVSRIYSTSLVINALSNCREDDFLKEMPKKVLIGKGVKYLLSKQCQGGEENGGWYFSLDDTRIHPNITSVVVYSLTQTFKYDRDRRVEKAIEHGIRYITKFWTMDDITEKVKYPTSTGNNAIAFHEFTHPHQMILPAALLSGEVGFYDNRVQKIAVEILNNYEEKVERFEKEPLDPDLSLNTWDIAETAFTLSTYYSVCDVVEHSAVLFANTNMYYQIYQDTLFKFNTISSEHGITRKKLGAHRLGIIILSFFAITGTTLSIYVTLRPEFAIDLNKQYGSIIIGTFTLLIMPFIANLLYDIAKNNLKRK